MAVSNTDELGTPALGIKTLKKHQDEGNADPVQITTGVIEVETAAEMMIQTARRAAEHAIKLNGNGHRNGKQEMGVWVRWAGGLLLTLLALVWGGSFLLASKTDEDKVEHMIESAPQHPDSKAELAKHEAELQVQKLQLNTIEGTVKNIDKTMGEIKDDLKKGR